MKLECKPPTILTGVALVALLLLPSLGFAQPGLGSAASYAVLAGTSITNTGATSITGDVGVSPGTSITGLPAGQPSGGSIHAGDAPAAQAQADLGTAYNFLAGEACNTAMTGVDLGGQTLGPGVYCFTSSAGLTGILTLDAQSDTGAVFVFQITSALTVADGASMTLSNGAQGRHVWWQVGSSATLGIASMMQGSILAHTSITLNTGASLAGRALAEGAEVTMGANSVVTPGDVGLPARGVSWGEIKSLYR
jgi:type VI secretion system secreted protein VgrG